MGGGRDVGEEKEGTSELRDEGHHAVLLEDLVQFGLHVLVHVGLQRVLQENPSSCQQVMQPVWDAEHDPRCRERERDSGYVSAGLIPSNSQPVQP